MGGSVSIGRVLGIPVSLHFSWFIVFVLFSFIFERHFNQPEYGWPTWERWVVALATSLVLFVSVLAHELSHSLVATKWGIPVKGITLFLFGGVSQISREASRPFTEFVIAAVGPFSSVVLGFIFLGLAFGLDGVSEHLSAILWIAVSVNIMLGIFNMLPGFPMDGGRVLRAVTWWVTGNYWRSTRIATAVGQVLAALFIAGGGVLSVLAVSNTVDGVWTQGLWMVVLGAFLFSVASASHRQARMRETLQSLAARDVMSGSCPVAPGDVSLLQLNEEYVAPAGQGFSLVSLAGRVSGLVSLEQMGRFPKSDWHLYRASDLMVSLALLETVTPDLDAYSVMELMEAKGSGQVLVMEEGVLLGAITKDSFRPYSAAPRSSHNRVRS